MNPFQWISKLRRRRQNEAIMEDEMRLHLDLLTEENIRSGMAPAEARVAAIRAFGGVERMKERCRDARGLVWFSQLRQDFGYTFRALTAQRTFTVAAVLTLAIGIGANTTVLSIINDIMFRPAALRKGGRIVAIHTRAVDGDRGYRSFSHAEFEAIREAHPIFSRVAAMQFVTTVLGPDDAMQQRLLCLTSSEYFAALGVTPWRGRFFTAAECAPSSRAHVVVASYELWRRLGRPEQYVGTKLRINHDEYTVVGIAPVGFGGLQWSLGPDAWLPLGVYSLFFGAANGSEALLEPRRYTLQLFGELAPGVTLDRAAAGFLGLSMRLNQQNGTTQSGRRELSITEPSRGNLDLTWPTDESRIGMYGVVAAVITLFVLVIACFNVAHMLFARGVARQKEIAIRLCLGASRGRVIRQLLVEGFVLAVLGGIAGFLLERWSYGLMLDAARVHTGPISLHLQNRADWRVLSGACALCVFATMCFALLPAVRATKTNLVDDLKRVGGLSGGKAARFFALRHCLVMAQVALSVLLLFVTVILVRAVSTSEHDRGFEVANRVVANVNYNLAHTPNEQILRRERDVLEHVAALPGVEAAALASAMPFNFEANWWRVYGVGPAVVASQPGEPTDNGRNSVLTFISNGYFEAMGIPIRRGRGFTSAEALTPSTRGVAVIDESLGRMLFGDVDPIGQRLTLNADDRASSAADRHLEIVGIIHSPRDDAMQGAAPVPRIYRPLAQAPWTQRNVYVTVKHASAVAPAPLLAAIRKAARAADSEAPVMRCEPMADFVNGNLNMYTIHTVEFLFASFGVISCLLAVVGVYGVKAHAIARRTQEIGIRIAIGARTRDVLRLLLRQSALQTTLGVAVGIGVAVLSGLVLAHLLYRVEPFEPDAVLYAAIPVTLAALGACLVPALRATRINPTIALRTE